MIRTILPMIHNAFVQSVISILACIILFSCHNSVQNSATPLLPELQQAESIMYESPDSALRLLQSMPVPQPSDRLEYATWALLTTQARYKLVIQQSDSLIDIAYDYFMKKGDAQRKALVSYYKGAIYKEHQRMKEAHQYYLQAVEEVEGTNDYKLKYLIYYGIADTYAYRGLNKSAKEYAEKAHFYAEQSNTPAYICSALTMLARIYSQPNTVSQAIDCYKQSIETAHKNGVYNTEKGAVSELIGLYFYLKDYQSISYYTKYLINLLRTYNLTITSVDCSVIGEAYRLMGKTDSVYYYLNRGLELASNVYVRKGIYEKLSNFALEEKDFEKAVLYSRKMLVYADSVFALDKSEEIAEIQEKYNQQKLINEKNALKMKKDAVVRNALVGLVAALLLIAILVYTYQKKLLHKERRIQEAEEEIRSKSVRIQENEQTISLNRKRMQELEEQMEADKGMQEELEEQRKALTEIARHNDRLEEENRSLQRDIDGMSVMLKEKSVELEQLDVLSKENLRLHDREWFLSSLLLENDETLRHLKQSPHYIREEEWEVVKRSIDRLFDHFTRRLAAAIPSLTENELQLCCLIKLHFSNPAIASMLAIEAASVSKRKFRLKERIIQKTGTWSAGTTLELWLWNF